MCFFAANSQFFTTSAATRCDNAAAVCTRHALSETVLVFSLALRWLEGTFHGI